MIIRLLVAMACVGTSEFLQAQSLPPIRVQGDHFVRGDSSEPFRIWGVNYDHDHSGRLLDEYWHDRWDAVVQDFKEIKALGANCVRIHLQIGLFMDSPSEVNQASLDQLSKLLKLSEDVGLYLDITGLACYHKKNIPAWYDSLSEEQRWETQARFWEAIAKTCAHSPAVFCYDLMNEPILPGKKPQTQWLGGELGGKFFVQRIALELKGRTRHEIAKAWVDKMTTAIREHDRSHLVTVGVIPWVFAFGGGKPLFYSPEVGENLDFVAVHFYPRKGEVEKAVKAIKAYDIGKPLVVEETFPLKCSQDELIAFIDQTSGRVDGWVSFYWGATPKELRSKPNKTIGDAITANWLDKFRELATQRGNDR